MAEKDKKVLLKKAMTWGGTNYAPGLNVMPEAAANSAIKRKFGSESGDSGKSGKSNNQEDSDFKPLGFEDTIHRFDKMDFSDDVMRSMQFHKETVVEFKSSGLSPEEFVKQLGDGNSNDEGLPEDFPMRHIFEKLGFKSIEEIQSKTREELIDLDGIGEASADKALAYGK